MRCPATQHGNYFSAQCLCLSGHGHAPLVRPCAGNENCLVTGECGREEDRKRERPERHLFFCFFAGRTRLCAVQRRQRHSDLGRWPSNAVTNWTRLSVTDIGGRTTEPKPKPKWLRHSDSDAVQRSRLCSIAAAVHTETSRMATSEASGVAHFSAHAAVEFKSSPAAAAAAVVVEDGD